MPTYSVDPKLFAVFPAFTRGVIIAKNVDNAGSAPELGALLATAAAHVSPQATSLETARIGAWNDAYLKFGADPKKYTPSIRFLYEQIRKGKPPRSINKLVDIMNIVSVNWTAPCGGDDLDAIGGDVRLGYAEGDETFAPLFKPEASDPPAAGEVIYYAPASKRVMCRRWTWRNADFSKISPQTQAIALNLDFMLPPFTASDLDQALQQAAELLEKHCGAATSRHKLTASEPSFSFD